MDKDTFILQLSQEYYVPLYIYAKHICQNDKMAKDIVQDVLRTSYLKANKLKKCPDIKGWLYEAVRDQLMEKVEEKKPSDSTDNEETDS